jgi:hypothetical protein
VPFPRAQYAIWSVLVSTITHDITASAKYLSFDYVIFRKDPGQNYTHFSGRTARGLPKNTLKVIEDDARDVIEGSDDLGAEPTSAHISVYEVPNLCLFVRNMTNVWQPIDKSRYKTWEDLKSSQLTAEKLRRDFVQRSIDMELGQAMPILLIIFSVSIETSSCSLGAAREANCPGW